MKTYIIELIKKIVVEIEALDETEAMSNAIEDETYNYEGSWYRAEPTAVIIGGDYT